MAETNKKIARLNKSVLVKNMFMSRGNVMELKRSVHQTKREDEPDEDTKDEELVLADTEVDLCETQKWL